MTTPFDTGSPAALGYNDLTWPWRWSHQPLLGELLSSGFKSDFTLLLGPAKEKVAVHKIFLQFVSPVLNSRVGKCSAAQLEIEDVDPAIFKLLLKYIYTGDSGMTIVEALPLLKMATDFEIVPLADQCATLLKSDITLENVLPLFQGAMEFANRELIQSTLAFICKNGQKVLKLDDFANLRLECLIEIIQQDGLQVLDEVDVFNAVHRWGEAELSRAPQPVEMRAVLLKALTHVRFPLMDATEFAVNVATKNVLDMSELTSMLTCFHIPPEQRRILPQGRFSSTPRAYIQLENDLTLSRTPTFETLLVGTDSAASVESLLIRCNTKIALKGFTIPKELFCNTQLSCCHDTDLLRVDVTVISGSTRVQSCPILGDLVNGKHYQINFDSPIKLLSRSQSTILTVKITGMITVQPNDDYRYSISSSSQHTVKFESSSFYRRVVTNFRDFVESAKFRDHNESQISVEEYYGDDYDEDDYPDPTHYSPTSTNALAVSTVRKDLGIELDIQRKDGDNMPMSSGLIERLIFGPI